MRYCIVAGLTRTEGSSEDSPEEGSTSRLMLWPAGFISLQVVGWSLPSVSVPYDRSLQPDCQLYQSVPAEKVIESIG